MTETFFIEGQKYQDFKVTRVLEITELKSRLIELIHEPTGAQVIHIANDDPENLFCLSFQTLPNSSDGVAHILEHTVLCGSKKFPVKDPFFSMTRRSLNTFMNALTGSDFTCYPAASQEKKDLYNLLEVYLDAVFHPTLDRFSFLQEGHRLEFHKSDDPSTDLEYKGIVFNEMKGAMSSPSARLNEIINAALLPNLTYGFNSGGDPTVIPTLTYEKLLEFHKQYYHPSRCLFFFYGDMPLEGHLDMIAKEVLDHTEPMESLPPIPKQLRFTERKTVDGFYPVSPDEEGGSQTFISFAWLTGYIRNQEELLALCIIDMALMDTDASPLKRAFLKSGLCSQATAYIDPEVSETPFVITLKGCDKKNADALEKIMRDTLQLLIEEKIPRSLIENAMHQLEFYRSEITGDHSPFGLTLFMRSALLKHHGVNPEEGIKIHTQFDNLHKKLEEDPEYFEKLTKKYLLDNTHFVRVVMQPDPTMAQRELEQEQHELKAIKEKLTIDEINKLIEQAKELKAFRQEQDDEDTDILPKVTLSDVTKKCRDYSLSREKSGNLQVFHHETFTNSIVYADLVWNLPSYPLEELWSIPLFSTLIGQMGCKERNYMKNLDYIHANTGGIGAYLSLNIDAKDCHNFSPTFHLRSKALYRKADKLFPLLLDMATGVDFDDRERVKEVFMKHFVALQSSLAQRGMKYAISLGSSGTSPACYVSDHLYGIDYYLKLKEIALDYKKHEDQLIATLNQAKEALLCLDAADLVLTCDQSMYETLSSKGYYGLNAIPEKKYTPWRVEDYVPRPVLSQGRVIASPVAFTSKVCSTVSYIDPATPALSIAANLMDNTSLHRKIREEGGAYGGGASCNTLCGNFLFYSYRDPHINSTLKAYEGALEKIINGRFKESDIEEAKLEKIQDLDTPISPGSRGDVVYALLKENKTVTMRQEFRDRLMELKKDEIIDALQNILKPNMENAPTVVFAGQDLLDKENLKSLKQGAPILPIIKS